MKYRDSKLTRDQLYKKIQGGELHTEIIDSHVDWDDGYDSQTSYFLYCRDLDAILFYDDANSEYCYLEDVELIPDAVKNFKKTKEAKKDFRKRLKNLIAVGITHYAVMDLINSALDAVLGSPDEDKIYRSDLRKIVIEEIEGYTWVEIKGCCESDCSYRGSELCNNCDIRTYKRYTCFDYENCQNYGDDCYGCKHSKQGKGEYRKEKPVKLEKGSKDEATAEKYAEHFNKFYS